MANVGACRSEQYGCLDLVAFDPVTLLHEGDAVAMNCMGDFVAQRAGKLLGVLHEIEQGIHDIDVAPWRGERVRLRLVNDEELEGK